MKAMGIEPLFIRIFSEEDFIMVPVSSGTGDCTETAYEGDLQRGIVTLKDIEAFTDMPMEGLLSEERCMNHD